MKPRSKRASKSPLHLKDESESTRRVAQASALAERGFYDEAIALLTNRSLETALAKGNAAENVRGALSAFDTMISNMDEAARWQLRKLYADTKQVELAGRIAPDLSVPGAVVGGQETANSQPPATNSQPATDYADPDGAFALRVPQGWTTKREAADGASLTTFSSGGPADPQITVISQPLAATQNLETFGPQWIEQILEVLRQNATVKAEAAQKAKFLGRDAMRAAVRLRFGPNRPATRLFDRHFRREKRLDDWLFGGSR